LDHEGILDRLRSWKIDESSVNFLVVAGGQANRFATLQSGSVSAVAVEPPLTLQARQAGVVELADLGQVPSAIATTVLLTTHGYVDRNQQAVQQLISAFDEAIQVYRGDEATTISALAAFLDLDSQQERAALLATREFYAARYATDLRPSI